MASETNDSSVFFFLAFISYSSSYGEQHPTICNLGVLTKKKKKKSSRNVKENNKFSACGVFDRQSIKMVFSGVNTLSRRVHIVMES